MKYRKKGFQAEPKSSFEKRNEEFMKGISERLDSIYTWDCPECSFNKFLLKSMVNNSTVVITCPSCGYKETMMQVRQ